MPTDSACPSEPVASSIPGYRNVARDGADALLVPPGDEEALAAAIRRVIEDPSTATKLVESGRERADEFSMARLAQLYLERYERLVEGSARGTGARAGTLRRR